MTEDVPSSSDRSAPSERTEADLIHDAVLQVPSIAGLSSGSMGEFVSYLPGRRVAGVRVDSDHIEVHVVAVYGPPMHEIPRDVERALAPFLGGRRLDVAVEDIVSPGDTPAADDATSGGRGAVTGAGSDASDGDATAEATTADAARQRRERRDWIRHHHPDVGGDPAVFVRGLARIERGNTADTPAERITVVRQRGPLRVAKRLVRRVIRRQPPRRLL